MSAANVSLIQSLYAAFGRGDIATIIAALRPEVEWVVNGRREDYPLCGVWKGSGGVQEFFNRLTELEEVSEFSPQVFDDAEDKVFVQGHYTWKMRKTGVTVSTDWIHVFTVLDGKVKKFLEFTDTAQFAAALRT
jgi:ketosteroid isomerase-like protein